MICTYTAVFSVSDDNNKVYARIPDIKGCVTSGKTLEERCCTDYGRSGGLSAGL